MTTAEHPRDDLEGIDPVAVAAGSLQEAVQPDRRGRRWARRRQRPGSVEDVPSGDWLPVATLRGSFEGPGLDLATPARRATNPAAEPTDQSLQDQLRLTSLALGAAEISAASAIRDRDTAQAARQELASLVTELSVQLEDVHLGRLEAEQATRDMAEARVKSEAEQAERLAAWSSELRSGLVRGSEQLERAQRQLSTARVEAARAQALAESAEAAREHQLATLEAVAHLAADAASAHRARQEAEESAVAQSEARADAERSAAGALAAAAGAQEELARAVEEMDERSRRAEQSHGQAMSDTTAAMQHARETVTRSEESARLAGERADAAQALAEEQRARVSEVTVELAAALEAGTDQARRLEEVTGLTVEAQEARREAELRRTAAEEEAERALAAAAEAGSAEHAAHAKATATLAALESELSVHRAELARALNTIHDQSKLLLALREEVLVQAEARAQLMLSTGLAPEASTSAPRLFKRSTTGRDAADAQVRQTTPPPTPTPTTSASRPGAVETASATIPAPALAHEQAPTDTAAAADVTRRLDPLPRREVRRPAASHRAESPLPAVQPTPAPRDVRPVETTVHVTAEPIRRRKGRTTIELVGNVVYIWRRKHHHIFDLGSRAGQVEVVGMPGQRGWRVLFHRRGLDAVILTSADVDPTWFTQVLRERGVA